MKAEVIEGFEPGADLIKISAESSAEADILEKLWNEDVKIVSGNRWTLVIASPKLAGLAAFYLNEGQQRLIHNALVQSHIKDRQLSSLLIELKGKSENE